MYTNERNQTDVLDKTLEPQAHGKVHCKQQLGGLIKSYYREAA